MNVNYQMNDRSAHTYTEIPAGGEIATCERCGATLMFTGATVTIVLHPDEQIACHECLASVLGAISGRTVKSVVDFTANINNGWSAR